MKEREGERGKNRGHQKEKKEENYILFLYIHTTKIFPE